MFRVISPAILVAILAGCGAATEPPVHYATQVEKTAALSTSYNAANSGYFAYANVQGGPTGFELAVIDEGTHRVVSTVPIPISGEMAVSATRHELYILEQNRSGTGNSLGNIALVASRSQVMRGFCTIPGDPSVSGALHMAADASGSYAYVTVAYFVGAPGAVRLPNGILLKIDLQTCRIAGSVRIGIDKNLQLPVAISPTGTRAYVSWSASTIGTTGAYDTSTMRPIAYITTTSQEPVAPAGGNLFALAINHSGSRVFAIGGDYWPINTPDYAFAIDTASNRVLGNAPVLGNAIGFVFSADDKWLFSTSTYMSTPLVFHGSIGVLNAVTNTQADRFLIGDVENGFPNLSHDGSELWIPVRSGIYVVNPVTHVVIDKIPLVQPLGASGFWVQ